MAKIIKVENSDKLLFYCEGCETHHFVNSNWKFNGNVNKPTFSPSILVRGHLGKDNYGTCHSFVKEGKIQYLNDCTHYLKGKTVELTHVG